MNLFGGNYSSMHSPYIQYDPCSYYHPYDFNGPNYASCSYELNDCYDSYNSSYAQASQYSNAYHDHSFQPYPSQDQSTQSSELHDLLLKMNNDSEKNDKLMQNSIDTCNRIFALCERIDKQFTEKNTIDTCDKGETYEENDNQMTNLGDEKEESKMHASDSSHQTPLDPVVEHEYIPQYDDGVISKRDGDILNFSFKDMEESSELSDSNSIHDLCYYFEDDIPPQLLNDDSDDYDDDIVSIDETNLFDEKINDALLEDEHIPHMLENDDSLITMPDMHDESDLNAVIEEVPVISYTQIEDMEIAPNLWSTERRIEESPIIVSIVPPIPGEIVLLEEICHEYHDPYLIPTYAEYHDQSMIRYIIKDMSHSFHLPTSLSCLHPIFMKSSKIFSSRFIVSKIKNHKKITLKVKFLPESVGLIHWEDCFPLFLLVYDLD